MVRTVLCFGSGVEGDRTPFDICSGAGKNLKGFRFVKCESPIELLNYAGSGEIVILDSVKGLKKPKMFSDIDAFRKVESVTAHDLDLGTFLKILSEMGRIGKVRIIGIPYGMKPDKVASVVEEFIVTG
jgi:hypothetical protein